MENKLRSFIDTLETITNNKPNETVYISFSPNSVKEIIKTFKEIEELIAEQKEQSSNELKLNELINEFEEKYGYELEKRNDACEYLTFIRTVEGNKHQIAIENHCGESDIDDWLIHSMLLDATKDNWDDFIDVPYPLTRDEWKMITQIIDAYDLVLKEGSN